jgi:hypothetical protein
MNSTIRQHLEDNPYPRAETPGDCLWRSLVIAVKHYCGCGEHSDQILSRTSGSDDRIKKLLQVLTRAASVPANTLTSGWAAQLVNSAIGEFFAALTPVSIYPRLAAIGGRFGFGRTGVLFLPTRNNPPTIAGSFVAEGAPIPVRQAVFGAIALTPKKMGVISAVSREISAQLNRVSALVNKSDPMKRQYETFMKLQVQLTKQLTVLATKLRCTQQAKTVAVQCGTDNERRAFVGQVNPFRPPLP